MGHEFTAFHNFHLRIGCSGAAAPGHGISPAVDFSFVEELFQKGPDGVIIFIGHSKVGIIPVHPHTQALGLLGLDSGIFADTLLAQVHEFFDAVFLHFPFGLETQFLFHLNFHPQSLAVEAVLVAELMAGHCFVAVVDIFQGPAPGVVHTHGVVGRDGPIYKGPFWFTLICRYALAENVVLFPELQQFVLELYEINFGVYFLDHTDYK